MRNSHASSPLYLRDARCINVLYALSVEDVDRHIAAAEVHGLAVVLHAEVDAVADDGAARVPCISSRCSFLYFLLYSDWYFFQLSACSF